MKTERPKILVVVGPTASGKSDLAVELALKFDGEVISADSRQVYKGLDIGTGKITPTETKGVKHYGLSIADPHERYTVSQWKHLAEDAVADILHRRRLPIICGGTGFYIDALINDTKLPEIETDHEVQQSLELQPLEALYKELHFLDPRRAEEMKSNGSYSNKRRVIRALLIAQNLGQVPMLVSHAKYDPLMIGIMPADDEIRTRIVNRLSARLQGGMIEEAHKLHAPGPEGYSLSYARMKELGLEYRYLAEYLQNNLTLEELQVTLTTKIWQYARRQKTWWRKNTAIRWFRPGENAEAEKLVRAFLSEE